MFKKMFFVFVVMAFTSIYSYSQESCSCSSGNCSASQTCSEGKAVCVCSAAGCSSSCSGNVTPEGGGESRLQNADVKDIGRISSAIFGKDIQFKPTVKSYKFAGSNAKFTTESDWNTLEELSKNGELLINGHKLDFWRGIRKTLIEGGEFKICSGGATAQRIINEISFISGKKFSIISGDADREITGQIAGNNLSEVIESLRKVSGVTIAEKN